MLEYEPEQDHVYDFENEYGECNHKDFVIIVALFILGLLTGTLL